MTQASIRINEDVHVRDGILRSSRVSLCRVLSRYFFTLVTLFDNDYVSRFERNVDLENLKLAKFWLGVFDSEGGFAINFAVVS